MKIKRDTVYRKIWEQNFCKIPKGFDIHHIDGNSSNNDIDNLIMLPHLYHNKYHELRNSINGKVIDCTIKAVNEKGNGSAIYLFSQHEMLIDVLIECNKWADYKQYLVGNLPNINGIIL